MEISALDLLRDVLCLPPLESWLCWRSLLDSMAPKSILCLPPLESWLCWRSLLDSMAPKSILGSTDPLLIDFFISGSSAVFRGLPT
jgi:hypothetical protein